MFKMYINVRNNAVKTKKCFITLSSSFTEELVMTRLCLLLLLFSGAWLMEVHSHPATAQAVLAPDHHAPGGVCENFRTARNSLRTALAFAKSEDLCSRGLLSLAVGEQFYIY